MSSRSALMIALLGFTAVAAYGQEQTSDLKPAERQVMVIRVDAELKSGSDVVGRVALAEILVGREVNGLWLWIPAGKGWIKQSDVVPIEDAVEHFTNQIEQRPVSRSFFERGAAHVALEKPEKALADFSRAIELDAQNVPAVNDRGTTYRRLGRLEQARADFDTVIERGVRHPAVYTNRGLVWLEAGNAEKAIEDLHVAIELDERFAPAWEASGSAREALGHVEKAIRNYRVAVEIDPAFAVAWNNLAWLLATTPDASLRNGSQAVEFATKACELTSYQKADLLDTLAAAHAEAGQFETAIRRAKEALEKADAQQKPTIAIRLELYEAGKPFRLSR